MSWRLAATQYSDFSEYAYLWWGVLSREQVSRLLEDQAAETIILFDLPDICYPQLFNIARKTLTGRIEVRDVFASNKHVFTSYLDNVYPANNMSNLFTDMSRHYSFLPNERRHPYDGFYKQVHDQFYNLHEYLHNGSLFWNHDRKGYSLQAEVDTSTNAAVVSICVPDNERRSFVDIVDIFSSNGSRASLHWKINKMFEIRDVHQNVHVSDVASAVEAVETFLKKNNLTLYDPFNLQRLAYKALGGSGYKDYEKFPSRVYNKLNLKD
ncbi:hypothetical protein ECIV_ORF21 [European chub iridovirus]|nr:hypothetical protein ECIV_ORF21 [European chub iridovirus]